MFDRIVAHRGSFGDGVAVLTEPQTLTDRQLAAKLAARATGDALFGANHLLGVMASVVVGNAADAVGHGAAQTSSP